MTRNLLLGSAILGAACSGLFATYTYYYSDYLTSPSSNWTENGTLTLGTGGLTSSNSNGGSLISTVQVPDHTSDYEVKTQLTLAQSGGTYITYLRASTNAMSGPAAAGTAYAFEVQNPTFSGSACTATLAAYKIINAAVTSLGSTTIPCQNAMIIRAIYTAYSGSIMVYVNNYPYFGTVDTSIASGQPGVGVRGTPSGNSIWQVKLGGIYNGTPTMPLTSEIGTSAFANRIEIQWPGASEDPSGPGISRYQIWRNSVYVGYVTGTEAFVDTGLTPSTPYSYGIRALDYDLNPTTQDTFSITTPPAGAIDARETGVRPTGSYWGGGGEQIDMLSGNLNYTVPILKAMGRGGWGVGFNLTYNSQNWRQDTGGTWQLGEDVGYGYGWKLLAGSLLPLQAPTGLIGEYLFTDATGAQYHLNQNSGGIWTSLESIHISYDSNVGVLHFNDGSFWVMGCGSAGTEWDAGTMYPTLMEDSNGNQVFINYKTGVGVTWGNSSSRISTVEDVRGNGAADYTFTYNNDPIPHLLNIVNSIGTAENYSFLYTGGYALYNPFTNQNFNTAVTLLESSTVTGISLTTYFSYDTASLTTSCSSSGTGASGPGQLTQVTTPYCGHLRWTYTTANTLSGSRTYIEVAKRYLSMSSGATESEIDLNRGSDTSYSVHSSATLDDTPSNSEKYWSFQTDTTQFNGGLQLTYEERTKSTLVPLSHLDFTWAQTPTSLNPYIGTTVTKLDPTQTYTQWKQTIQTLDQYGNLLTMKAYNFGNGAVGSLARTYTNTYLSNSNYTPLYIFNRLLTSTVTDGTNTSTLVSNTYDIGTSNPNATPCGQLPGPNQPPPLCEHDANYSTSFFYRGNVATSTTPTTTSSIYYDITGSVFSTVTNGVRTNVTTTNNYAAPGQITTNTLTSTMSWSNFLGLSSATGPNGDGGSIGYDSYARPYSTTSPYGAVTNYTYNDTASPPSKTAITDGHFATTVMDGFGRTIQTVTGYGTTMVSTVGANYAPCGCSPLGKLHMQSQPYGPGGSELWTTYTYDASGRTTSVVLPDNSTTAYLYQGNTIKVTDPAGKWKTFTMDALGNLVSVEEPDPSLGNVTTNYTYDILNHLTVVSMPRGTNTQTRTFNYNSGTTVTGFLQSATNPENGTVSYTYGNGLLATKTDAKNQQLAYSYDAYNRLTSVGLVPTYTCPPPPQQCIPPPNQVLRTYYYDTNPLDTTGFSKYAAGRLTAVQYPAQSTVQMNEMYSYSVAGLPLAKRFQVNEPVTYKDINNQIQHITMTANLDSDYTYNGEGEMLTMSYPSTMSNLTSSPGASYTYSYDSMYRLSGMTDSNHNTIVSGVTYNAANQMLTGVDTRTYNVLGQLTSISSGSYENLTYNYPSGTNNGKVSSLYNAISGETVTYTYDSLNRLLTANGSGWGQQYGFDSFGNLLSKTVTAGSGPSLSQAVNPANNQIVGAGYDANGNTGGATNGGVAYGLGYDPENRMVLAMQSGYQGPYVDYYYDAQNHRIWSWSGAVDAYSNTTNYTVNIYSPGGQKLGAYLIAPAFIQDSQTEFQVVPSMQVTLSSSDTYFGSRRLGVMDQLGSTSTFYPWGEAKGTNPQNTWNFATYWQDSTTGLDYANNRYYSNAYGRFMTPDPYQGTSGGSGDPSNPQSWNRYAYTTGDPVNWVDSQGLFQECPACSIYNSDSTTVVQTFSTGGLSNGYVNVNMNQIIAQAIAQAVQQYQQALGAALSAAEARVATDLAKPGCAKDFKNVSNDLSKLSTIGFSNYGIPQFVTNTRGQIVPQGQGFLRQLSNPCFNSYGCYNPFTKSINLNYGIDWLNLTNQEATLNGVSYTYNALTAEGQAVGDSSISGSQFMDITILHELSHYNGAIGNPDNDAVEKKLWNDCLK